MTARSQSHGRRRVTGERTREFPSSENNPKKIVPPLVLLSKEDEATAEFVKETNLTKAQLLGLEKIPVHEGAGRKPFVIGEPLMWPELIETLPTRMREFHKWYLKASAEGYIMIAARIKNTHFYREMDDIWINFDHFLFIFHQDALDKSLVSVWSM